MIHLLFTADRNYAARIPTVLKSAQSCHPGLQFGIHLISDDISNDMETRLESFCRQCGYEFTLYRVPEDLFRDAPVNKHYSKTMYYRMLASYILPETMDRVLYIDPDILVINPLVSLWELDLEGNCYAAASHTEEKGIVDNINRLRLETSSVYFNTGVLLMDLARCRLNDRAEEIFAFIRENGNKLLLPDQDVFNALFGEKTKEVPDEIWNYDARKYSQYLIKSGGTMDERWVIRNTAILHYCGKEKPWNEKYRYRFGELYRHYEHLCELEGWKDVL